MTLPLTKTRVWAACLTALFLLGIFSLLWGPAGFLWGPELKEATPLLIDLRLPRLLLTATCGFCLGLSGAAMQGLFRNPLADPALIGVSAGSTLGAVTGLFFASKMGLQGNDLSLYVFAFCGGIVVTSLIFFASCRNRSLSTHGLLLAGLAINALAAAIVGIFIQWAGEWQLRSYTFWMLGGSQTLAWNRLLIYMAIALTPALLLFRCRKGLNALALGEAEAFYLGFPVRKLQLVTVFACAATVSASVAVCGTIAFVGLVIPHILRILSGSDHRSLLPLSGWGGAALLVAADIASRGIAPPMEIPLGILTSLIGAPFFLFLILRRPNPAG